MWSIVVHPNNRGIVTGSADKTVKFWTMEVLAPGQESNLIVDEVEGEDASDVTVFIARIAVSLVLIRIIFRPVLRPATDASRSAHTQDDG